MKSKIIKNIIFIIIAILVFSIIFTTQACDKLDIEIFGLKFGEKTKNTDSEIEDTGTVNEQSISDIEDDSEDLGNVSSQEIIGSDSRKIKTSSNNSTDTADIAELRLYFMQAMEYFEDGSYLIAEYYLNKINDSYLVLQDHIFYYMAKSLFYQEKYDQAEEYYLKLIKNYPDSIWAEIASLEYADMFYIREDYITAENEYEHFRTAFPHSSNMPYCLFQLAICQEMNGKKDLAFENYKQIWLNYPLNEYAETVWENLIRLPAEDSSIEPFIPTANQIYNRGEIFFSIYHYYSALDEFNRILQGDYLNNLSLELHSKTLFKIGMCYYNIGDYNQSKYYLLLSYEKSPSGSLADYSLYYMGRALTNLDLTADAISYYQKLLQLFPKSNYGDDALYRIGRIYSLKKDFKNAASYFQRVSSDYPGGDKLPDALWELGLIQYRSADYSSAKNTFSNYASSYKGTSLEEKGLFWQAKCCQKLGENDKAADLYKKIISLNSYSYYTFASGKMLAEMNEEVQIKKINNELNPENPQIAGIIPDIYAILEEDSYIEDDEINHINKAIELLKLEFFNSASLEIEAGSSEIKENPARILEIATLFLKSNDYANSINVIGKNLKQLKSGLNEPYIDYLYYLYYPYGYKEPVLKYSSQYHLDPRFTLAVIRQESLFRPDAVSRSEAQGLMQIWPPTGKSIADQIGISNYNINLLLDPETNIRMGTYYLRQQLDNFGQNEYEYCLGAYNKGPAAMSNWISRQGDMDIYEFIESISSEEAREYIKKVMGNYYFYQMLYD